MNARTAMNEAYSEYQNKQEEKENKKNRISAQGFIIGGSLFAIFLFLIVQGNESFSSWTLLVLMISFFGCAGTVMWAISATVNVEEPSEGIWKPAANEYLKERGVRELNPALDTYRQPMQFTPRIGSYPEDPSLLYSGTAHFNTRKSVQLDIRTTEQGLKVIADGKELE